MVSQAHSCLAIWLRSGLIMPDAETNWMCFGIDNHRANTWVTG